MTQPHTWSLFSLSVPLYVAQTDFKYSKGHLHKSTYENVTVDILCLIHNQTFNCVMVKISFASTLPCINNTSFL